MRSPIILFAISAYVAHDASFFFFFFFNFKKTNLKALVKQVYFHFSSPFSLFSVLSLSPPQSFTSAITTTFGTKRHHRRCHPPNSTGAPPPTTPTIRGLAGRTPLTAPDHCRHHQALMPTTIQCLRSPPTVPTPTISPPPIFPKIFPRSFL
jgi:hypothetical protein